MKEKEINMEEKKEKEGKKFLVVELGGVVEEL